MADTFDEKNILSCLWQEIALRQEHYWSSFKRFALAAVTINVVPYVKPELGSHWVAARLGYGACHPGNRGSGESCGSAFALRQGPFRVPGRTGKL